MMFGASICPLHASKYWRADVSGGGFLYPVSRNSRISNLEDETMFRTLLVTAIVCGLSLHSVAFAQTAAGPQGFDADITNRVVQQLSESDRDVARWIHVSTENGVVTLEGTVFTPTQIAKILTVVRALPGVIKVDNRLRVLS
jgi:BON domain